MFESVDQAITILHNTNVGENEREDAARYLEHHPTDAGIEALVIDLDADDPGVRWVCAECLANLGEKALPPLVDALCKPDNSPWLRDGAHHAFKNSSSYKVRTETAGLMKAFGGAQPQLVTLEEAMALRAKMNA